MSKFTAYRWFREGTSPVPAERAGRLILVNADVAERESARTVLYARVSSHGQRSDLDRQVARLTGWATGQGMAVAEVVVEVGSGMNGKVAGWLACWPTRRLRQWSWSIVIVWLVSGSSISKRRCRRRGAGLLWWTLARLTMI